MNYEAARNRMAEEQIIFRGITDEKVVAAFKKVPRHEFMPQAFIDSAYADHPVPIGEGQTISQPYMVALMTACLRLKETDKVLEIGTGSGYQMAILLEIAKEVYSVERIKSLADRADALLQQLGYSNFKIKVGDGTLGWEEHSPYDVIIVTAASPRIPQSLVRQLKEGGRLVIPVGGAFGQTLTVVVRKGKGVTIEEVCGCVFVPLLGKEGWQE